LAILLTSASAQPPEKPAEPPPTKLKPDPAAVEALKQALDRLDMKRYGAIKTDLWQEVDVQGISFQTHGSYWAAPGQRLRLKLTIDQLAGAKAELQVICDGSVLWETSTIGTQDQSVTRVDLKKVLEVMNDPDKVRTRESFLQSQSFAGMAPLLENLKTQITFTKTDKLTWNGRDVIRLSGTWVDAPLESKQWQEYMPRECRLYLDAKNYWPLRVEWWGPTITGQPRSEDSLLMQLEFRNHERPKELAAKDFTYDPGSVKPTDKTEEYRTLAEKLVRRDAASR
jgi:hypothetical protein